MQRLGLVSAQNCRKISTSGGKSAGGGSGGRKGNDMTPEEFEKWMEVFDKSPVDADGDSPFADLAWRAVMARVEQMEERDIQEHDPSAAEAARAMANAFIWAAFWLALGAVLSIAIWQSAHV